MTLDLALVIRGDAKGAKQALDDTAKGVEDLGKKAKTTNDELGKVGQAGDKKQGPIEWAPLSKDLEALQKQAGPAADALDGVGKGLADTAAQAPGAASGIANVGTAAGGAMDKIGGFRTAAIGFIGGLAASLAAAGVGALLDAAGQAFIGYAQEILSDTPRINRDLESHKELIAQIKGAWKEAEGGASSYGLNSTAVLRFQAQQDVSRLTRDVASEQRVLAPGTTLGRAGGDFGPLTEQVRTWRKELDAGKADFIRFREELAKGAEQLPADSPQRAQVEKLLEETKRGAELQAELARAKDLLKGLQGDADAAATALGGSADKYQALGDNAGAANPKVEATAGAIAASGSAAAGANPALAEYADRLRAIASAPSPRAPDLSTPSGLPAGGFAVGGFTGHAPTSAVAGFVHGQEYVFDAASTARIGVANLDAIRSGVRDYAAGGAVFPTAPSARGGYGGSYGGADDSVGSILAGGLKDAFRALLDDARNGDFSDFWEQFLKIGEGIADRLFSRWVDQIVDGFGQSLGGGGGSLFGSLFSGAAYSPAASAAIAAGVGGLFDVGGYTGPGPRDKPAGVVHAGEIVWSQDDVSRAGGVATVEAMRLGRRGYAGGGIAGLSLPMTGTHGGGGWSSTGRPVVNVSRHYHDYAGVDVEERETDDGAGGVRQDIVISRKMAQEAGTRNSPFDKALSARGLPQKGPRR